MSKKYCSTQETKWCWQINHQRTIISTTKKKKNFFFFFKFTFCVTAWLVFVLLTFLDMHSQQVSTSGGGACEAEEFTTWWNASNNFFSSSAWNEFFFEIFWIFVLNIGILFISFSWFFAQWWQWTREGIDMSSGNLESVCVCVREREREG